MFPIFRLGPLSLKAPGLLLLIALWIGITLAEKSANYYKISAEKLTNLVLTSMLAGILGARLAFFLQSPQNFAGNPLDLISLDIKLLDLTGGIAIAIIAAIIYGQKQEMKLRQTLDALIPFFGMLVIGIATANLASGNAFGMETDLPWGIELWEATRHPTQIYTMLAALVTLQLVWPPKASTQYQAGVPFLTFLSITLGYLLFIEAFRGDSSLIFGNLRALQVIILPLLALSLWGLDKIKSEYEKEIKQT